MRWVHQRRTDGVGVIGSRGHSGSDRWCALSLTDPVYLANWNEDTCIMQEKQSKFVLRVLLHIIQANFYCIEQLLSFLAFKQHFAYFKISNQRRSRPRPSGEEQSWGGGGIENRQRLRGALDQLERHSRLLDQPQTKNGSALSQSNNNDPSLVLLAQILKHRTAE